MREIGNVGSSLGPPAFAASVSALGAVGLMAPALVLCASGFALAALAARMFEPRRPARSGGDA